MPQDLRRLDPGLIGQCLELAQSFADVSAPRVACKHICSVGTLNQRHHEQGQQQPQSRSCPEQRTSPCGEHWAVKSQLRCHALRRRLAEHRVGAPRAVAQASAAGRHAAIADRRAGPSRNFGHTAWCRTRGAERGANSAQMVQSAQGQDASVAFSGLDPDPCALPF